MKDFPDRKDLRLKTFNYSANGLYFLTICTHEKQCLFSEIEGAIHEPPAAAPVGAIHESPVTAPAGTNQPAPKHHAFSGRFVNRPYEATDPAPIFCKLTPYGNIVEAILQMLPLQFENVGVTDYIIMPNHVHMIVELSPIEDLRAIRESPLPDGASSKRSELSKVVGYFKMQVSKGVHAFDPDLRVWQRGYYDHIIRDFEDYKTKAEYIATNPLRWLYHIQGEAYQ